VDLRRRAAARRYPTHSFTGGAAPEIEAMLPGAFLNPKEATLEQNALIVNTGRQLVLFDTGHGRQHGRGIAHVRAHARGGCCEHARRPASIPRRSTW
jgi:hypothetical protein